MAMSPFDPFALTRWEPFGNMTSLHDAMNRLMESSVVRPMSAFGGPSGMNVPLDLSETEDNYRVQASLPGMKPEDVHITVQDNVVTIEGERVENQERKEGERSIYTEHHYGSFSRSFSLPMAIDANRAQAEFKDGMLSLTLPKSEAARPRQIRVNGGSTPAIEGQTVQRGSQGPTMGPARGGAMGATTASGPRARGIGATSRSGSRAASRSTESRGSMGTSGAAEMGSTKGQVHRKPVGIAEGSRGRSKR